ncbi:MAG: homoserine kinase [Bradymonadia bacterium]|jgi:homoserine kinase
MDRVEAFAPATVANLGPGFDVLGLALEGLGDRVVAERAAGPLQIIAIEGDDGRLPRDIDANTAGIAAKKTLQLAGHRVEGIALTVFKGLPIGSGLGSSAASAVAAAWAVNALIGSPLSRAELVPACLAAEAAVSGRHADNLAPSLFGGLVLVRRVDPLDLVRLPVPSGLQIIVVTPAFELATKAARAALPPVLAMADVVQNAADLGALVAACHADDAALFGRSLNDVIATPARLPLIPGGVEALDAAREYGALGVGISGAGPSVFAVVHCGVDSAAAMVGEGMRAAFANAGLAARVHVSSLEAPGVRIV